MVNKLEQWVSSVATHTKSAVLRALGIMVILIGVSLAWAQPAEGDVATPSDTGTTDVTTTDASTTDASTTNTRLVCPIAAPLQLGVYSWQTSQLINAIVSYLLSEGYGCSVEQRNGLPEALELALVRGELDILLGASSQYASLSFTSSLADGTLVTLATLYARQDGFYISRDLLLAIVSLQDGVPPAETLTVADVAVWFTGQTPVSSTPADATSTTSSETPSATPSEIPAAFQQLAFVNCSTSWLCYDINLTKLAAYDINMAVLAPASASEVVSSLQTAQASGTPWFGFAWSPSWLVHTYDLVRLEEPPFTEECWQSNQACNYPTNPALTVTTASFAEQLPEDLINLFGNLQFEADVLSDLLSHNQGGGVSVDETRDYFLRTYPEVWQAWLSVDASARVQAGLEATSP
jgi:ABC-type proline/glycine betaine transport system substrate-binding protein